MYCPQNVKNGNYILLRIPENKGGPGNPSAPIDFNAFALPTSGLDLACVVPNFSGIPAVTANPHKPYSNVFNSEISMGKLGQP